MYVVAVGNAFDGIELFGTFSTGDDAAIWAAENIDHDEWIAVKLVEVT